MDFSASCFGTCSLATLNLVKLLFRPIEALIAYGVSLAAKLAGVHPGALRYFKTE